MRQNQRQWYYNKLDQLFPSIKQKYIQQYGNAYQCRSLKAQELWQLFQKECDSRSILYKMADIIRGYKLGYEQKQLSIFDIEE